MFLSAAGNPKHLAATVKSNMAQIEGGEGLRIGIVPESTATAGRSGVQYDSNTGLWIIKLADPNGFMGLFNDAYVAVARALCHIGKQPEPTYWTKPSAKAQRVEEQIEKYPSAKVIDIEGALNEAAQQDLIKADSRLVSVNAPHWLHMKQLAPKVISPRPRFDKI